MSQQDRQLALEYIDEAVANGASRNKACEIVGISIRTLQRWQRSDRFIDQRQVVDKRECSNKLTEDECRQILDICNSPEFANCSVKQIVPALADQGIYIASESSFYRVLRQASQSGNRRRVNRRGQCAKPKCHTTSQANQLWSWDITFLSTCIKGVFYYLYLIMDVYSRKIVGWEVYDHQSDTLAKEVLTKAKLSEGLNSSQSLVLHSDNGAPMKGATMLATMQELGVVPSFSRPSVSNDNPYSESLFKTLKYVPTMPEQPFEGIEQAREWVVQFVDWYNYTHKHSQISYVTPNQRHTGQDMQILANRKALYEQAKADNPSRWSGNIRNWQHIKHIHLNKYQTETNEKKAA